MDWATGQYLQLIIALSAGIILFVAAYTLQARGVMWVLLLLVPFQLINSQYGSINLVLTYMVGAVFILHGRFVRLPLQGIVAFIALAYALSFSQTPRGTAFDHALYLIAVISNFTLFYLVYNFVRSSGNYRDMWNILAAVNVLVLIYCVLEVLAGTKGIRFFGIAELEIRSSRAEQGYFIGPFKAIGMTAEYLAIQSLMSIYALMRLNAGRERTFWLMMLAGNMAFMVATGSRGGIISFVIGLIVFLFLFRKEVSMAKMITWITVGSLVFMLSSFVVVHYTSYNLLFNKLEGTEFVGGLPDTRQGWRTLWNRVVEDPVIGHGPRMQLMNEAERNIPGFVHMPYPHNAYMFLIYTIGFVGLSAYLWFFSALARQYWRGGRYGRTEDPLLRGLPLLGVAILVLIASSQARMEMFRYMLHAYQQYVFMLLGALLAFSHMAMDQSNQKVARKDRDEGPRSRKILQSRRVKSAE